VYDHKEDLPRGFSEGDPSVLIMRMHQVRLNQQERIAKNRRRLFKIDAVFLLIEQGL
jgi:hypothetical protein